MRKIEVAVLEDLAQGVDQLHAGVFVGGLGVKSSLTVPVFAGEAAEGYDRCVSENSGFAHQLVRQLGFGNHAGRTAGSILSLHMIAVEIHRVREDGGRVHDLAQAIV